MIKKVSVAKKVNMLIVATGLFVIGCHFTQQTFPTDAAGVCTTGTDALTEVEFNSWFETGSVSLDGAVKPANSVLFDFDDDCQFHKWTEQMFLWLTSPAPRRYGAGGLVMNTPVFYDVSLPDENGEREFLPHTPGKIRAFNVRTAQKGVLDLPIIMEKKSLRMLEILPTVLSPQGKQLIADDKGNEVEIGTMRLDERQRPVVTDKNGNAIQRPRALLHAAKDSASSTVLKKLRRLRNFDRTSLVQKVTIGKMSFFLDLFGNFHEVEQGQADGSVLMAQNGSLVYYSVTVNNVYALFRTMQGTAVDNDTQFPTTQESLNDISVFARKHNKSPIVDSIALALEIKASWVEVEGLIDRDKFITMKAVVPNYRKTPTEWIPVGTRTIELAMVGMHVVGSTAGHPEMLWGTFEHLSNDPAAAYMYRTTSDTDVVVPQNTDGNWIFCADGTNGPFNEARMVMNGDHIQALEGKTIGPSNILRIKPWGIDENRLPASNSEMIVLNNTVHSLLDPGDVRRNYFQTGTTWTINGSAPGTLGPDLGNEILANTTMETFTQGMNCFSCHVSNTTAVSHIFNDTKPLF